MKENMFLIIVMAMGSFFLSQCNNASSTIEKVTETQRVVDHEISSEDLVISDEITKKEEQLESKPEIDEKETAIITAKETEDVQEVQVKINDLNKTKNNDVIKETGPDDIVNKPNIETVSNDRSEENVDTPPAPISQSESNSKALSKQEEIDDQPEIEDEIVKKESKKEEVNKPIIQSAFSHDLWNTILKNNVTAAGKVNYNAIKSNVVELDEYLKLLSENTPQTSWSKNKTKAYWINAYNAFTVKLIVDNYPVGSIMDLHGGKPWDKKWIELGNKTYSLNDIEHVILRPTYNDPRIHFAVNCAAKSCPKVWNQAWTETNIESALDKLTRAFVSNVSANQINAKSINLSKIFEWYAEDFGDLIQFLNKYSATKISADAKVAYNDYDWKLNS